MHQLRKQISVALISLLFLLFIVPLVSATSETFTVPAGGSHNLTVDLKQQDNVRVNVTVVSWGADNNSLGISFSSLAFEVKTPNGNIFRDFNINYDKNINIKSYFFSAPTTGTYVFLLKDTTYTTILTPSQNKTVTLAYTAVPYDPVSTGVIFVVAIILAVASITFVGNRAHKIRKRKKAILESSGQGNLPNSSAYDEMLTKRAREILGIKDSSNISWEESKQGILLRCKNAWLSNTELFYRPSYFPISNMAEASVNERNILTIKFVKGEIREFKLAPDEMALELTNKLSVFNQEFANDTFRAYLKGKNQQWADSINGLIHQKLEEHVVTCKYCGAKNKDTNVKCHYCGANL